MPRGQLSHDTSLNTYSPAWHELFGEGQGFRFGFGLVLGFRFRCRFGFGLVRVGVRNTCAIINAGLSPNPNPRRNSNRNPDPNPNGHSHPDLNPTHPQFERSERLNIPFEHASQDAWPVDELYRPVRGFVGSWVRGFVGRGRVRVGVRVGVRV